MKRLAILSTVLAMFASPGFAQEASEVLPVPSDNIETFRSWKEWTIYRNNSRGHCFGTKSDGTSAIQLGLTKDETLGYIGAFVKRDFTPAEDNKIAIKVGETIFTGETSGPVGDVTGDWHGGYVLSNNKDFRRAIEKNNTMLAFPSRPYAYEIDIKGANNAIFEIKKCTDEMG